MLPQHWDSENVFFANKVISLRLLCNVLTSERPTRIIIVLEMVQITTVKNRGVT